MMNEPSLQFEDDITILDRLKWRYYSFKSKLANLYDIIYIRFHKFNRRCYRQYDVRNQINGKYIIDTVLPIIRAYVDKNKFYKINLNYSATGNYRDYYKHLIHNGYHIGELSLSNSKYIIAIEKSNFNKRKCYTNTREGGTFNMWEFISYETNNIKIRIHFSHSSFLNYPIQNGFKKTKNYYLDEWLLDDKNIISC